jgi:hypothetical protein
MPIFLLLILQYWRKNYVLIRLRMSEDGDASLKKGPGPFFSFLLNLYEYLFSVQRKHDSYPDEDKDQWVYERAIEIPCPGNQKLIIDKSFKG